MLLLIGIIIAIFTCLVLYVLFVFRSQTKLPATFKEVKHELVIQVVGCFAILDDFIQRTNNKFELPSERNGEVAVITGGNRGIGLCVIEMLLQCSMTVVIGVRNEKAAEDEIKKIREKGISNGQAVIIHLDLSSMESVKSFAVKVNQNFKFINLLINNAGIMFTPYVETVDGFEQQLAVNYLGHFYLTHLLLPSLSFAGSKSSRNARVINVSSVGHKAGSINFHDIHSKKSYIPAMAYVQSKLAQIMFSHTLNDKLARSKTPVQVHSVNPGVVDTDLFQHTAVRKYIPWFPKLIFKSPKEGAISIVYAALSDDLEQHGGSYISNCKVASKSKLAKCNRTCEKLFIVTKNMLNIRV